MATVTTKEIKQLKNSVTKSETNEYYNSDSAYVFLWYPVALKNILL
jgi:hypothetical protein